jgi:hypothetical protein
MIEASANLVSSSIPVKARRAKVPVPIRFFHGNFHRHRHRHRRPTRTHRINSLTLRLQWSREPLRDLRAVSKIEEYHYRDSAFSIMD